MLDIIDVMNEIESAARMVKGFYENSIRRAEEGWCLEYRSYNDEIFIIVDIYRAGEIVVLVEERGGITEVYEYEFKEVEEVIRLLEKEMIN